MLSEPSFRVPDVHEVRAVTPIVTALIVSPVPYASVFAKKVLASTNFMHFLVLGDTKLGAFEEILRQKVLASTNFMHFLVLGDTKLGVFEEILRQKVLASTNFCQILVLGDT